MALQVTWQRGNQESFKRIVINKISMRDTFVKEITKVAEKNSKIVILAGDIGYKLFDSENKIPLIYFLLPYP